MDFTKYGLDEENLKKIKEDYQKHIEVEKAKAIEPYSDYETLKTSLETYKTNEKELNKKINTLSKDKDTLQSQYDNSVLDNAINSAFYNENIKHADLFAAKIDRSKLVKDESGNIIGLNEQIASIKETYKDLLDKPAPGTVGATPQTSSYQHENIPINYDNLSREDAVAAYKREMQQNNRPRRF